MIASIFLGPTMSYGEARQLLPDAVFHPPAAQGDLLAAVDQDGADVIGLIDGTFHLNLSVWHNEVCYLLSRGITVYGASSMGALRGTETDRFGMVGIGTIYEWYRDGVITGDDEVALIHGDQSSGFRPMSHPLVNIRASVAQAVAKGSISKPFAEQLVEFARSLYYPERQVPGILQLCRNAGFPEHELCAAERALTEDYVDLKRSDARVLLMEIRRVLDGTVDRPPPVAFEFSRSGVFETLYNLDRQVLVGDITVTLQDIAEHVALHHPAAGELRRAALHREVAIFFALLLGLRVTQDDIASERTAFLEGRTLTTPDDVHDWLRRNAISEADLGVYLAEEALCRRLRHWVQTSRSFDRGAKALLDELRARGDFPDWATQAAESTAIIRAYQGQPEYQRIEQEDPARLAEQHAAHTGLQIIGDARVWAEDAGFDGVTGLIEALRRAVIFDDVSARITRELMALGRIIDKAEDANCQDPLNSPRSMFPKEASNIQATGAAAVPDRSGTSAGSADRKPPHIG